MAFDNLLESVITAVISGGGTAASGMIAVFSNMRARLSKLEEKLGSIEGKSGISYSVNQLEGLVNGMRQELNSWVTRPPDWLIQVVRGIIRRPSFIDGSEYESIDAQNKARLERRMVAVEELVTELERKVHKCVSEADFEDADKARAEDIATIRTTVAEVNGLLKGLQSALGLLKR